MPAHASRTLATAPSAPPSCAERRLLAPAPPGARRRTRRTLRQPGIPLPQASIGGSGPKQVRMDAWWRAPATRKPRNEPCRAALGRGLTMLTEQAMSRQRRALLGRGGQRPRTTVSGTPLRGPLASRRAPPRRPLTGLRGSAHTRAPPERPRPRPHGPHIRAPSRRAPADPRGQHRPTPPGRPPASPRGQHSPTPARRPPASPRGHHSPTPSRRPPASPRGHHSPTPSERRATHRARRRFRRTLLVVPRRNSSGVLRTSNEPAPNQKPLCHPLTPQHHNDDHHPGELRTLIAERSYARNIGPLTDAARRGIVDCVERGMSAELALALEISARYQARSWEYVARTLQSVLNGSHDRRRERHTARGGRQRRMAAYRGGSDAYLATIRG